MIFDIAQIILGALFFLFLPGWLLVKAFFDELKILEKILLAVVFSIMIGLVIGVFFGYDRAQAVRTGGFTKENIWLGEIVVTLAIAIMLFIKKSFNKKKKFPRTYKESKRNEKKVKEE